MKPTVLSTELEEACLSYCPHLLTHPHLLCLVMQNSANHAGFASCTLWKTAKEGSQRESARLQGEQATPFIPHGSSHEHHFRSVSSPCSKFITSPWQQPKPIYSVYHTCRISIIMSSTQKHQQELSDAPCPETWVPSPQSPFPELRYTSSSWGTLLLLTPVFRLPRKY